MESGIKGKRALVTGAGKGIGRGIALRLAELGATVVAISRTQADLESLKKESPSIETVNLDISDWDVTRTTMEGLGHFELLVNNAGVYNLAPILEMSKEILDRTYDINFKAPYNISQVVARGMVSRGQGGAIVNISSTSSKMPFPKESVYGSSKAALDFLTMSMALELGPFKIRTNAVQPGLVLTRMGIEVTQLVPDMTEEAAIASTPLKKLPEVKDVVDAVVFLLSDHAAMINGVKLTVDGGSVLP